MQPAAKLTPLTAASHPERPLGQTSALYVWQYPLRLFHWGMVISLCVLAFTGYYIHDPFIVGQAQHPFLMASFRFVHETFGMILIALFILRVYLFFKGNRWVRWRQYVPLRREQFQEMFRVAGFYAFLRQEPVSKIGHNALAACSYIGIYALIAVEIASGLVLYNQISHNPFLTFFIGWIPHVVDIQALRLIHFFLMYVFFAFGIFHVHLCMLISREEKRGLMDSIFIGYKVIPDAEIAAEDRRAREGK